MPALSRAGKSSLAVVRAALDDEGARARYQAKIRLVDGYSCSFWIGAVSSRGHGRLWLGEDDEGRDVAVIAHRFGYGLVHGFAALRQTEVVSHTCDNPLCQDAEHWKQSTHAENRQEWDWRRHRMCGPLRDLRGARARAILVRDAVRDGRPLAPVLAGGVRDLDAGQLPLWT